MSKDQSRPAPVTDTKQGQYSDGHHPLDEVQYLECKLILKPDRGTHHPLCGEFAFQAKFKRRDDVHEKAMNRCQQFFIALQQSGRDWLFLGTTKTGLVYRLKGNPPQSHE
jgi:hypothetical protein